MTYSDLMLRTIISLLFFVLATDGFSAENKTGNGPGTKDWTIVDSYPIPGKASGLAWDGTYLYFGMYGTSGDQVFKVNPETGSFTLIFSNPDISDSYGMTCDGENLWITDHGLSTSDPAWALQLDFTGTSLSQFDLPDHYMSGIAYDDGDFWVCTYYPDPGTIYKVDASGAILEQIPSPDAQPWDICLEGDNLWVADYYGYKLYKIDQEGNILEEHDSEGERPAGIVFDGEYLWYVDGPLGSPSTLYKVSFTGSGTPGIDIPVTSYDYGTVALGDSSIWNCSIGNTGTADLEVSNLLIQNAVPIFMEEIFPIVVEPGSSADIDLWYKPTEAGTLNTIVTVESNDPVTPEVELTLTGEAVYSGPHIVVPSASHAFGTVRINATTRWFLEIQNDGDETLEISELTFDNENFYAEWSIAFPAYLDVLESRLFGIWFNPDATGTFEGTATITHNDGSQDDIEISLSGSGNDSPYPIGEDFWNYPINTSYDNSIKAIAPIGDVSDDGIADVIVCSEDGFIRCFNGNSSGQGDVLWENEAGTIYGQTGLCTVEDLDGDSYPDAIAGLAWGVRAVKAISGRTGETIWTYDTHVYGDGGWVYQVWAELDYNGDGITDVLASTGNDGNNTGPKRIFCLDGNDGTVVWDTYTDGPNFSCIGVSDFTGDGVPDALGGASNNGETEGKVYGINGSNGSIEWTYSTYGTSVWALEQLDDINGDDVKDVIAGDFGGNYYLMDATNGSIINSGSAGTSLFLRFERLDDVNGNGFADIAFAYSGTNAIVIDGQDGGNIWMTPLADKCWNIDLLEDITGDGISDLIAGTLYSNNFCYFLDGASGDILHSFNFGEAVDAIGAIPDVNGDGSWEMVTGGRLGSLVCYSSGEASVLLQAEFSADTTNGPAPLAVNFSDLSSGNVVSWEWDFDNDGAIDATIPNPSHTYTAIGTYSVSLTVNDGTTSNTLLKEDYIQVYDPVFVGEQKEISRFTARPNPFQNGNEVLFELISDTPVIIEIKNFAGQAVATLNTIKQTTGSQIYKWNPRGPDGGLLSAGVYVATAYLEGEPVTIKLVIR